MKMDRARLHLHLLEEDILQFASRIDRGDAYEILIEYDAEARQHIFRLHVLEEQPSIPWGIMVGDVVHNMRSALDHFVEQLTIRHSGHELANTGFPIFDDGDKFSFRDRGPYMIRGCSDDVQRAITKMQPYLRDDPKTDPLWTLHDLWNMDKHRVVPIIGIVATAITFRRLQAIGQVIINNPGPLPFVDGAELDIRMLLTEPLDPEAKVELNL